MTLKAKKEYLSRVIEKELERLQKEKKWSKYYPKERHRGIIGGLRIAEMILDK